MYIKHHTGSLGSTRASRSTATQRSTASNAWSPGTAVTVVTVVTIAVMLIFVAVALVGDNQAGGGHSQTITVSEPQAGSRITMHVGDILQVTLEGNPTTGYNWSAQQLDTAVLKQVGEPGFHPASGELGASGTVTCRFQVAGNGQTTLKLIYSRSFEEDIPPLRTFAVTVVVAGQ